MASLTLKNIKKVYPHNGDDAKKAKKKKKGDQPEEKKVNLHNNYIERTFKLEGQMSEVQHDIKDLKGYHKPHAD